MRFARMHCATALRLSVLLCAAGVLVPRVNAGEVEPRPNVVFTSSAITVKSVSKAGVLVQSGSSRPALLGWDRVKSITGTNSTESKAFADMAERLWRLRLRIEREDFVLAEPMADELAIELKDAPGPSLTLTLAAQTACRLKRGARTAAVDSWLGWLDASSDRANFFADAGPIEPRMNSLRFDDSGLIPELHPFWLDTPAVRAFAQRATAADARGDSARLAWLYVHAAAFEAGQHADGQLLAPASADSAAVMLVNDIVTARIADGAGRAKARTALIARLSAETVSWRRSWLLAGNGRSLVRESERDQKLLGIDALLQVGGSSDTGSGDLAAVCLAEAIIVLHDLGETAGAASLKATLFQRFSSSPVLTWPPLRKVSVPMATPPVTQPAANPASGATNTPANPATGGAP